MCELKTWSLTQGASGRDLIFAEACQVRGAKNSIRATVSETGIYRTLYSAWRRKLDLHILRLLDVQTEAVNSDPFERSNL